MKKCKCQPKNKILSKTYHIYLRHNKPNPQYVIQKNYVPLTNPKDWSFNLNDAKCDILE